MKMKLFQSSQEKFAILGITSDQSIKNNLFNGRILAGFLVYILTVILIAVFIIHDANTIWEYANNIYNMSGAIIIVVFFANIVFKMRKFFALIDSCVTTVAKSKFNFKMHSHSHRYFSEKLMQLKKCLRSKIESDIR